MPYRDAFECYFYPKPKQTQQRDIHASEDYCSFFIHRKMEIKNTEQKKKSRHMENLSDLMFFVWQFYFHNKSQSLAVWSVNNWHPTLSVSQSDTFNTLKPQQKEENEKFPKYLT